MKNPEKYNSPCEEAMVTTICASHCGGSCLLKLHVKDGVISRIDTDDGKEPQLRACLRGRAYRQRVYAPDRLLYPMRRVGERGEGRFERITWDEALDTVANEFIRVRDTYGPASILYLGLGGDLGNLNTSAQMSRLLAQAGGFTSTWGVTSFQGGIYAQQIAYGTYYTSNTRDDLVNSRLIVMWGWNPTSTITGVNTGWYLAQAKEAGARIVSVDPRYTESTATFAHKWIPIRPGTDGAMLLGMAHVMIEEGLHNRMFLETYTVGFEKFREYVMGEEDGVAKTPGWAEEITGVPVEDIAGLAREYATIKPAALIAGIAPGRTAYGEQYHRIAIALAAMTGNIGIHGGDAAGRSWESVLGGYPYSFIWGSLRNAPKNIVEQESPKPPKGSAYGYGASKVHRCAVPDFILKGKNGGFHADCKMIAVVNFSYLNAIQNVNKIAKALKSKSLEFLFVQEQFMTPTVKFADIVLPTNTYMERNDITHGVGLAFYGYQNKAVESIGESKSHYDIVSLLAPRLGVTGFGDKTEDEWLRIGVGRTEIPDYDEFKRSGVYRLDLKEPYVAFKEQIEDPEENPFPTPSGKIEIYSKRVDELNDPEIPAIPRYMECWEGWNDPLRERYPLQMISTHFKTRANNQFGNIPWLSELAPQEVWINRVDAEFRGIGNGDMVRIYNDRGKVFIRARVTERIMPGVVDLPHGAWYDPDENGIDRGGCPNVLTSDAYSSGGSLAYNSCLVEIEPAH